MFIPDQYNISVQYFCFSFYFAIVNYALLMLLLQVQRRHTIPARLDYRQVLQRYSAGGRRMLLHTSASFHQQVKLNLEKITLNLFSNYRLYNKPKLFLLFIYHCWPLIVFPSLLHVVAETFTKVVSFWVELN